MIGSIFMLLYDKELKEMAAILFLAGVARVIYR